MALRDWIKQKLADKVLSEGGQEHFLLQDWGTPPADPVLALDKRNWGGTRVHVPLDAMEAMFGSTWPASLAFGAKPVVLAKLKQANLPTVMENGQPVQQDLGYAAVFDEWTTRGLIK